MRCSSLQQMSAALPWRLSRARWEQSYAVTRRTAVPHVTVVNTHMPLTKQPPPTIKKNLYCISNFTVRYFCSTTIWPLGVSFLLDLHWCHLPWRDLKGVRHSLMNVSKVKCAFLLAAPLDACVLNHTLIGVSLAERQPYLYTLKKKKKRF